MADLGASGALSAKSPATVAAGSGPVGVAVQPDPIRFRIVKR